MAKRRQRIDEVTDNLATHNRGESIGREQATIADRIADDEGELVA